ncbi:MAG: spermidine/putrescine ABC transporter substrate-binding protein, partial [Sporichthyaceae bacterium]
ARSATEKVVDWSNWPEYIDAGDNLGDYPTLAAFTRRTGITVNYTADYFDNERFVGALTPRLRAGQQVARDLWCSTDWMVARLVRQGYLAPLRSENIPHRSNLEPSLADVPFDRHRRYSLPWQSGFTGIGYHRGAAGGPVTTIAQLFTDKRLKGKVTLLTDVGDTVGLTMLSLGIDPSSFTAEDFMRAVDRLTEVKDSGQLKGFTGNDYVTGLASGEIAACLAYSGDLVQLEADTPETGFTLPESGHLLWSDNFVIPRHARHRTNAEKLIDFYYDPQVMAQVEDWVNYIPPVVGARQALLRTDPDVARNPLIFPSAAVRRRGRVFKGFAADEDKELNAAFGTLMA